MLSGLFNEVSKSACPQLYGHERELTEVKMHGENNIKTFEGSNRNLVGFWEMNNI